MSGWNIEDRAFALDSDNYWYPATVQDIDGDNIFVTYDNGNEAWVRSDSLRELFVDKGTRIEYRLNDEDEYYGGYVTNKRYDRVQIDESQDWPSINSIRISDTEQVDKLRLEQERDSSQSIDQTLSILEFQVTHAVQGRMTIEDLFPQQKQRGGIYVLHMDNGFYYVGQSKDVTKRYQQHCQTYANIERLSFKRVRQKDFDAEERHTIQTLEHSGFPLLNIIHTTITYKSGEFDIVMTPDRQRQWLEKPWKDIYGQRIDRPDRRGKYVPKHKKFHDLDVAGDVITLLKTYIETSIPAVYQTELDFWGCTCYPQDCLARINIYWQEVFAIFPHDEYGVLCHFYLAASPLKIDRVLFHMFDIYPDLQKYWHMERLDEIVQLAKSLLDDERLDNGLAWFEEGVQHIQDLCSRHPDLFVSGHWWEKGGPNQLKVFTLGVEDTLALINDEDFGFAMRLFNLGQMRKGRCVQSKYHCPELVDDLFGLP